jgi:hypothetical protein
MPDPNPPRLDADSPWLHLACPQTGLLAPRLEGTGGLAVEVEGTDEIAGSRTTRVATPFLLATAYRAEHSFC